MTAAEFHNMPSLVQRRHDYWMNGSDFPTAGQAVHLGLRVAAFHGQQPPTANT